ncbi:hypothetical protein TNCV_2103561 [Trichonephila clavipes]|nr:hypothetical protein TNCV_2103561 [Trichonephila clavipes]
MPSNHTTWPLSIFCIMKIHRLGPGSNPQPKVQKGSDKPITPPSRQALSMKLLNRQDYLLSSISETLLGLLGAGLVTLSNDKKKEDDT